MSQPSEDDDSPYARGLRDAARDATIKQHAERLNAINGSLNRISDAVRALENRFQRIELAREKETAVNQALATYLQQAEAKDTQRHKTQITAKQLWISVVAIIVPVITAIVVAIIVSGHLV